MNVPAAYAQTEGTSHGTFEGPLISVDFRDVSVREALKVVAEIKHLNIVIDPEVQGRVTMKLTDVPWGQVLELLLRQRSLSLSWMGSEPRIARVSPLRE